MNDLRIPEIAAVKKLFLYNPVKGEFTRISVPHNKFNTGDVAGTKAKKGNVIGIDGVAYPSDKLAVYYATGVYPYKVYHLDGDRYNDRLSNLYGINHKPSKADITVGILKAFFT